MSTHKEEICASFDKLLLLPRSGIGRPPLSLALEFQRRFHANLLLSLKRMSRGHVTERNPVWATSILETDPFGHWVVTHSLADADFHGHRVTVLMNQRSLKLLEQSLVSSQQLTVESALPVLLTKTRPTRESYSRHNYSKKCLCIFGVWEWVESKLPRLLIIRSTTHNYNNDSLLSWGKFRLEPATRWFDWSFAAIRKFYEQFAR